VKWFVSIIKRSHRVARALSIDRLVSTVSNIQDFIELYSVWLAVLDVVKRRKLIYGYHEESFASLALHLQDGGINQDGLRKSRRRGSKFCEYHLGDAGHDQIGTPEFQYRIFACTTATTLFWKALTLSVISNQIE
jgi:hypothetical protein